MRLICLLSLLLSSFFLRAQTVYELYRIPENDVPRGLTWRPAQTPYDTLLSIRAVPPAPFTDLPPASRKADSLLLLIANYFPADVTHTPFTERKIGFTRFNELGHGLHRFRKGARFGIKDSLGRVLVQPTFHRIEKVARAGHFIGFGSRYANVYDLQGRALFPARRFVYLVHKGDDYLLTRSTQGYGIARTDGSIILSATNKRIFSGSGSYPVFHGTRDSSEHFTYAARHDLFFARQEGTMLLPEGDGSQLIVFGESPRSYFDLKANRWMPSPVQPVENHPHHYVFSTPEGSPNHLIDERGNILATDDFHSITKITGEQFIAVLYQPTLEEEEENSRPRAIIESLRVPGYYMGTLDENYDWVIPPVYASLSPTIGPYLIARDTLGAYALLNLEGKAVSPTFADCHSLNLDSKAVTFYEKDEYGNVINTHVYSGITGKEVISRKGSGVGYLIEHCGKTYFAFSDRFDNYLFTEDGRQVAGGKKTFFNYNTKTDRFWLKNDSTEQVLDCDFNVLRTVKTNGLSIDNLAVSRLLLPGAGLSSPNGWQELVITDTAGNNHDLPKDVIYTTPLSYPGLLTVRDVYKRYFLFFNAAGEPLTELVSGSLLHNGPHMVYPRLTLTGETTDFIREDGRLLFGGRFLSVSHHQGLYTLEKGEFHTVGNLDGSFLVPVSKEKYSVRDGLIEQGDRLFLRDGTRIR